jgi:hypothetical protein
MHMVPRVALPDEFVRKVDFYMYQSGHGAEQRTPYELAEQGQAYAVKRPVVNGEPCYEGHGKGRTLTRFRAFDVRKATWQSLLAGAKVGVAYGGHGVWSCHSTGMGFVNPTWKFLPYDWDDALRLPGAWDVGLARWLWEHYGLWDVQPAQELLAREDDEVRVSRSATKIVVYLPHAYDISLKVDLAGYRCELWDLAGRRPMVAEVEAGETSTIVLTETTGSAVNGDVLVVLNDEAE